MIETAAPGMHFDSKAPTGKRLSSLLACANLAAAILLATPSASAQRRASMPTPAFHSSRLVREVPPLPRIDQTAPRRSTGFRFRDHRHGRRRAFGCIEPMTGPTVEQQLARYPGYGFDFERLSTVNRDLAIKAAIDPATELQLQELEQLGCSEAPSWGYFLLGSDYVVPDESVESGQPAQTSTQPQIIIVEERPPAAQTPEQAATATQPEAPPLPEERQLELVLRNGSRLQAIAFTQNGDKLIYMTPAGTRRSIALSSLDIAATILVNEERRISIQFSF